MPEFVEAEAYRRTTDPVVGHRIRAVVVRDDRLLRRDPVDPANARNRLHAALTGERIDRARRHGKLVLLDVSSGHTVAVGFGLRGRLALDGRTATPTGEWHDVDVRPEHVRLVIDTVAGRLVLEDQLRLATVDLDPDEHRLGVDVLSLDAAGFRAIVDSSDATIKSLLMDQKRIAGIGNLIADEMLYQAGVDPRRPASGLSADERSRLWTAIRRTRERVLTLGGSHRGVLIDAGRRERGARCPRCAEPVRRIRVGGRTTYYCPAHQR